MVQIAILSALFTLLELWFLDSHMNETEMYAYHDINAASKPQRLGFVFLTNFLLLVRLIPLDVIVNTEIGKIIVSKIIQLDVELMCVDPLQSEDGLLRCKVQSLQLPEELGTINHIFSDKTGTLTKNELILRSMSLRGIMVSGEKTDIIL